METVPGSFHFSSLQKTTGNVFDWELTDGVTNSRATSGSVTLRAGPGTPDSFHYMSHPIPSETVEVIPANSNSLPLDTIPYWKTITGGKIRVVRNSRPSYHLNLGKFDDGSNSVEDGVIIVTQNGRKVSTDSSFGEGTQLRVTLRSEKNHLFEGWQGNLPFDLNAPNALPRERSFMVTMDRDITLKAHFSSYAPASPSHLEESFLIDFTPQNTNEFGDVVPGAANPPHRMFFGDFSPNSDEGAISGDQETGQDIEGDGVGDNFSGRVSYAPDGPLNGLFRVFELSANLSSDPEDSVPAWGGEMEIFLQFEKPGNNRESGSYLILRGDGSMEQGLWESSKIRKPFSLQ